jgi:hypothetical protein
MTNRSREPAAYANLRPRYRRRVVKSVNASPIMNSANAPTMPASTIISAFDMTHLIIEHDLFRKPVPAFRDHALLLVSQDRAGARPPL